MKSDGIVVVVHRIIDVSEISILEVVVAGLGMSSLVSVHAGHDGHTAVCHTEIYTTTVRVHEEGTVEDGHCSCQLPALGEVVRLKVSCGHLDEIAQYSLLLLPEILSAQPGELKVVPRFRIPLDTVEAASPELIDPPDLIHVHGEGPGQSEALGSEISLLRAEVECNASEIPGNLQVVADDPTVLLPAVSVVIRPVLVEPLANQLARVVGVPGWRGEVSDDILGDVDEHRLQLLQAVLELWLPLQSADEVDQVRRDVIADRVPVLLGLVDPKALGVRLEAARLEVREVASVCRLVQEEVVKGVDGCEDVLQRLEVPGDAIKHGHAGQCVDLLVQWDGATVVTAVRREMSIGPIVIGAPEDVFTTRYRVAESVSLVFHSLTESCEVFLLASQLVRDRITLEQTRENSDFLRFRLWLEQLVEVCAITCEIDRSISKEIVEPGVTECIDHVHPPLWVLDDQVALALADLLALLVVQQEDRSHLYLVSEVVAMYDTLNKDQRTQGKVLLHFVRDFTVVVSIGCSVAIIAAMQVGKRAVPHFFVQVSVNEVVARVVLAAKT